VSASGVAEKAVAADLASTRFRAGARRGHWRKVSYEFPVLLMAVAATEPDGAASEYFFRFELTGFPGAAPEVMLWDVAATTLLAPNKHPKGTQRVTEAFKAWGKGSIYRPWDRHGSKHNNWSTTHPELAWHPKRDLTFILEDLHGLLTSNAAAHGNRPPA
jgi:hypothetical protein